MYSIIFYTIVYTKETRLIQNIRIIKSVSQCTSNVETLFYKILSTTDYKHFFKENRNEF